jgi:UDP-4-amino-4,6-dideoxy-N-acetyl-beta-L-altrosamine transaminase
MTVMPRLAIDGGRPVRAAMLPYGRHWVDEADIDAVVAVLRSDWLTTGPTVEEFEAAFAKAVGARHATAVSSGTAALHAAAFAAGIGPGQEVITTPMTFAATANCVRYLGGTVAFADVLPDTLNLDPAKAAACVTARTKAVITVDYTGEPSDLDELDALSARHGLTLIEDASHALGATYRSRAVGSVARLTTFSLHPVKHITTGEGGVVTTDDPNLAARLRRFRNHGITREHQQRVDWRYEMVDLGYNYRLSDIQSALGISQLKRLQEQIARRREIAGRYARAFAGLAEIEALVTRDDRESAWHLYVIRLRLERLRVERAEIYRALRAENIGVNVHYIPVPWHPYYESLGFRRGGWPVAESAYERILSLPIFPTMTDADVDDVVRAVEKVVGHFRR